MRIISHRGWWQSPSEKNQPVAFHRTIAGGFGTETDVRDRNGELVVSNDPALEGVLSWETLLNWFDGSDLPLAVNVKADGLSTKLEEAFAERNIKWFAFDMSAPEMIRYASSSLPFYTRQSEYELQPVMYSKAGGVWLDSFEADWFDNDIIRRHVDSGKAVCVVSPELHGRDCRPLWDKLKHLDVDFTLCTDCPAEAKEAFGL